MFVRLLKRLLRRAPKTLPAAPAVVADAEEPPPGCGWFDSSHELQAGLLVLEHASADAVAASLPLGDWLTLHLRGWHGAALDPV